MLAKFRHRYPQGSLVSELIKIDRGIYIVKALVQVDSIVLATALAAADTVEAAEDAARDRAIATLFLDSHSISPTNQAALTPTQPETVANSSVEKMNEPKIVNFAQPESEISEPRISAVVEPIPNPSPAEPAKSSKPQLNLELEPEPEPVSATPAENNLFGDTFTAEIPTVASLNNSPQDSSNSNSATATAELDAMDFNEIKQKTDIEIRRLGWSKDQGKEFLMSHYGKRSRLHLTDEQLLEFLRYLEKLPNPVS